MFFEDEFSKSGRFFCFFLRGKGCGSEVNPLISHVLIQVQIWLLIIKRTSTLRNVRHPAVLRKVIFRKVSEAFFFVRLCCITFVLKENHT